MTQADPYRFNSPTRALLWKEWRQQQWVFLAVGVIPPLAFLSLLVVSHFVASVAALIFFCAIPVVLGANAFCSEDDEQTARFLNTVPVSWSSVFRVKALMALILNCAAGFVLALVVLVVTKAFPPDQRLLGSDEGLSALIFTVPYIFIATLTTAIVSTIARRTISCILTTVCVLALSGAWIWLLIKKMDGPTRVAYSDTLSWICLGLVFVLPIIASRWLWCWAKRLRPLRARIARVLLVGLLFVIITGGLPAGEYVYVTWFAPLNTFTGDSSRTCYAYVTACTPDGKSAVILCGSRLWKDRGRSALVDTDSGEWRWLSRFHESYVWRGHQADALSPDYLMVLRGEEWLWPFSTPNPVAGFKSDSGEASLPFEVVDLNVAHGKTVNRQKLLDLCPDLSEGIPKKWHPRVRWLTPNTAMLWDGQSAFFANVEDGTVTKCDSDLQAMEDEPGYPRWSTDLGFFGRIDSPGATDTARRLCLARYAPDLPVAEIITLRIEKDARDNCDVLDVSSSGRWCLVRTEPARSRDLALSTIYLCSTLSGDSLLLRTPETSQTQGPVRSRVWFGGFVTGRDTLLFRTGDGFMLFDAETREQRTIPLPDDNAFVEAAWHARISPSGKYAIGTVLVKETVQTPHGDFIKPTPRTCLVDLEAGTSKLLDADELPEWRWQWLGDDKLIWDDGSGLWIMNPDGTGKQPLLKEDRKRWTE